MNPWVHAYRGYSVGAVSDTDLKKINSVLTVLGGVVVHDTGVVH